MSICIQKEVFNAKTCIIRMLDDIRCAADRRMVTISIFFDFSKAFDSVQHGRLLRELKRLNFSNSVLRWLASYLSDRVQAVRDPYENNTSSLVDIRVGVPQGSVLGPLLFTLYISGLKNTLR